MSPSLFPSAPQAGERRLKDAQIGLIVATPLIAAVAIALHRAGALGRSGAVAAVATSVAIAAMLFLSH
jgi:hypothetical protein